MVIVAWIVLGLLCVGLLFQPVAFVNDLKPKEPLSINTAVTIRSLMVVINVMQLVVFWLALHGQLVVGR